MNKMVKIAIVLVALTSVFSFADSEKGGFKMGFQGSIGDVGSIGALFNLGNGLEIGLGLGIESQSAKTTVESQGPTQNYENSRFEWLIIPSVAYQLGKKDLVGYGAGLDLYFSSWSETRPDPSGNGTITNKPEGMRMAFVPNFYISVEPVKNFVLGLKTGIGIVLPPDDVQDNSPTSKTTTTYFNFGTLTSVYLAFYL